MNLPDRSIDRLLAIMQRLRSDTGCPWDREQTLSSLKPFLVEECYEALDALDSGDRSKLCEELGDVLLQVVFQSQLCAEEGSFTFEDVAAAIGNKLIRRHPHIFGDTVAEDAETVVKNWDAIKKQERATAGESTSALAGVPKSMPALARARQIQARAARTGFDWPELKPVLEKLDEEVAELKHAIASGDHSQIRNEIGDVLFTIVNVSRFTGDDPDGALHGATSKFIRRFHAMERALHAEGRALRECTLEELDTLWNRVKAEEGEGNSPS